MNKDELLISTPDKKKFLLDMVAMSTDENFEIAKMLQEQSKVLNDLAHIARSIGDIKQGANSGIYALAREHEIELNVNKRPREFDTIVL